MITFAEAINFKRLFQTRIANVNSYISCKKSYLKDVIPRNFIDIPFILFLEITPYCSTWQLHTALQHK